MKNQTLKLTLKMLGSAVLMAAGTFAAGPNAANGALDITAVSTGVIFNDTNPQHIEALVSIVDSNGAPVTGLTTPQFMVSTYFVPPAAQCGLGMLGAKENDPGFYSLYLARANEQCKWQLGDYLLRVAFFLGNAQGQATLKVTIKQIPFQGGY